MNSFSAKWVEKNSIAVAMYGATVRKSAIIEIPLTTNQACCNFRNLILGENDELKNRHLLIDNQEKKVIQSVKDKEQNISKCNICTLKCTLEEMAILQFVKDHPKATQKEIAV